MFKFFNFNIWLVAILLPAFISTKCLNFVHFSQVVPNLCFFWSQIVNQAVNGSHWLP